MLRTSTATKFDESYMRLDIDEIKASQIDAVRHVYLFPIILLHYLVTLVTTHY
jgi:hypothetical protein